MSANPPSPSLYSWPQAHRTARDFIQRIQTWYQDPRLIYCLIEPRRAVLLASAFAVLGTLIAVEKVTAVVNDAEKSLFTLKLESGQGSTEHWADTRGFGDDVIWVPAFDLWLGQVRDRCHPGDSGGVVVQDGNGQQTQSQCEPRGDDEEPPASVAGDLKCSEIICPFCSRHFSAQKFS